MVAITVTRLEVFSALIVVSQAMSSKAASNLRTRMADTTIINPVTVITVIVAKKTMAHKMSFMELWICDSGARGHYCNSEKGLFQVNSINKSITVGNGKV
jgi:hypothetical protein